jgi:hypothetical protein
MPSITGQPAVDVAIGLFFAFFLLSVLCSAINEAIATRLAWRSDTLLAALRSMLADASPEPDRAKQSGDLATNPTAAKKPESAVTSGGDQELITRLLDHSLVRSLVDERSRNGLRRAVPSYIPSRTFALALLDTLTDKSDASDDAFVQAQKTVDGIGNMQLKQALSALLADARGSIDRYYEGIAGWFDATMERASGWYKRRAQRNLWVIAVVVTVLFNADAAQMATSLWKDPVLRASVVSQAQAAAKDTPDLTNPGSTDNVTSQVERIRQLKLPLGWSFKKSDPRWPDDAVGWVGKLLGLAATVIALSLGAPFWFDLLGKVSRLRGTGAQPQPAAAGSQVIVAQLQPADTGVQAAGRGSPPASSPGGQAAPT